MTAPQRRILSLVLFGIVASLTAYLYVSNRHVEPQPMPHSVAKPVPAVLAPLPDPEDEAIENALDRAEEDYEARRELGHFGDKVIPHLIQGLSGSAKRVALSISLLWDLRNAVEKREGVQNPFAQHEKELMRALESSRQTRVRTVVRLILHQIGSPDALAAANASRNRQTAFELQSAKDQKARETTLQTLAQVLAPIRPSEDPAEEFETVSSDSLLDYGLFVTVHRNQKGDALLEIWKKEEQRYRRLRHVETHGDVSELQNWQVFGFSSETFLLVPVQFSGSGNHHMQHLFHVDRTSHTLEDVTFRATPAELLMLPGEVMMKGGSINFSDNLITVDNGVWARDACNACDHARVTGTYVIVKDSNGGWVMRPGTLTRTDTNR
jgi:hypothetical protein